MKKIRFALLRGVCQTPAYVAYEKGFLADEGLDAELSIAPTAWMVPEQLLGGQSDFAVIPWTRVAAALPGEAPLKLLCGSGREEAVIVVRKGLGISDVRTVAIPREGGMKDLTAMGLIHSLGWERCELRRFPSGDGAIIAFVGEGADAASMVEPYAAMMERLGIGVAVRRTGDVWPGAPGCSLSASAALIASDPDLVQRVVDAYLRAATFVHDDPQEAARLAAPYIGVHADTVRRALAVNRPDVDAVRNRDAMEAILALMQRLGYVAEPPRGFADLRFLDHAQARRGAGQARG
ncbi:MAG: ABC transporter substrate-binding protein [Deltaproteobacteria bacterium]|nr:ABC transporter substrate-binding protein [Deltaproteobacteria bacterium]